MTAIDAAPVGELELTEMPDFDDSLQCCGHGVLAPCPNEAVWRMIPPCKHTRVACDAHYRELRGGLVRSLLCLQCGATFPKVEVIWETI